MTRASSIAIICMCADRDPITERVHGDRYTKSITCCFSIEVTPKLRPSRSIVRINSYVTRASSIAIICMCADRDPITARIHGDRIARAIKHSFAVNITTELRPGTGGVFVNAHVTRVSSSAVIARCTDRDPVAVRVHGDRMARIVIRCFAINVCAELRPRTGCVFVNAHVTRARCSTIIKRSSDRDPITARIHGDRIARLVICCFPIDVRTKLRPS